MGTDSRRLLVATVVSIAVLIFWEMVLSPKRIQPGPEQGKGAAPVTAPAPAAARGPEAPAAPAVAPVAADAPEERIALEGEGFRAEVSTYGGTLASVTLQGKKFVEDRDGKTVPIDIVRSPPGALMPFGLVATPENGGGADPWVDAAARAPMRVVSQDGKSVVLEGRAGALGVRKTYRVTGKPYELALDVEVDGASGAGGVALLVPGQIREGAETGGLTSAPSLDVFRAICRGGEKTARFAVDAKEAKEAVAGQVAFAGLDMHYFVLAVMPAAPAGQCEFSRGPQERTAMAALTLPLEAGSAKQGFTIYAGPKDVDALRSYGRSLETAIDYGPVTNLFAVFARGLLVVMRWFHALTGGWGAAIILLTVLVKLLLFPLTYKSMQSMNAMRLLQPEIEKLKAKHKDDREKMNVAVMQLYQKHKVNPLGGCLPMLLQMPVWFALYAALQTSVELYREPFLWMTDLTVHDPYYILPALLGISSFAMQKLSPQPADAAQAKLMLYFMPAFFTFIMLKVPGGLTVYIVANNLLTIVQQRILLARQAAATKG